MSEKSDAFDLILTLYRVGKQNISSEKALKAELAALRMDRQGMDDAGKVLGATFNKVADENRELKSDIAQWRDAWCEMVKERDKAITGRDALENSANYYASGWDKEKADMLKCREANKKLAALLEQTRHASPDKLEEAKGKLEYLVAQLKDQESAFTKERERYQVEIKALTPKPRVPTSERLKEVKFTEDRGIGTMTFWATDSDDADHFVRKLLAKVRPDLVFQTRPGHVVFERLEGPRADGTYLYKGVGPVKKREHKVKAAKGLDALFPVQNQQEVFVNNGVATMEKPERKSYGEKP
jgi:hypothetical protein